jgi:hypothetical protein
MSEDYLFEVYRGDDYSLRLEIKDSNQVAVDITGWSFKATMKLSTEMPDEEAGLQLDIDALDTVEAANGVFYLLLPKEQTKDLIPTGYFFDLQRESGGMVSTLFAGKVLVKADVTHRV